MSRAEAGAGRSGGAGAAPRARRSVWLECGRQGPGDLLVPSLKSRGGRAEAWASGSAGCGAGEGRAQVGVVWGRRPGDGARPGQGGPSGPTAGQAAGGAGGLDGVRGMQAGASQGFGLERRGRDVCRWRSLSPPSRRTGGGLGLGSHVRELCSQADCEAVGLAEVVCSGCGRRRAGGGGGGLSWAAPVAPLILPLVTRERRGLGEAGEGHLLLATERRERPSRQAPGGTSIPMWILLLKGGVQT